MREKQALIEEVCAANPAALAEIGAKSENSMARVAAIRQSEGFVIFIETRDGTVHTIAPARAGTNDRGRAAPRTRA
jgi:hypothetical protein